MENTITHILVSNVVLCFVLSLHWLSSNALRPLPTRLLGLNYCLYAFQALMLVLIFSDTWKEAVVLRVAVAMLLGPGLYLYFQSVANEYSTLSWKSLIHILPAISILLLMLTDSPWRRIIDLVIPASFSLYLSLSVFQMRKLKHKTSGLGEHASVAYRWLLVLCAFILLNIFIEIGIAIELASSPELARSKTLWFASLIFLLANLSLLLFALKRSAFIEWMYLMGVKSSEALAPSSIDEEEIGEIFGRWQALVDTEQLFAREGGISLKDAARMMSLPARKLSVAINRAYGGSFSQYLNDCRVTEAKRLILNQKDLSLTAVMYDAGFSSKSTFNKEFLRVVGKSPSAYRQGLLDG